MSDSTGVDRLGSRHLIDILSAVLADIRGIAHDDPAYRGGPQRLEGVGKLEAIARLADVTWHLHALNLQPPTEFGLLEAALATYRAALIWADQKCYRAMGLALEQLALDTAQAERGELPRGSILNSSLLVQ